MAEVILRYPVSNVFVFNAFSSLHYSCPFPESSDFWRNRRKSYRVCMYHGLEIKPNTWCARIFAINSLSFMRSEIVGVRILVGHTRTKKQTHCGNLITCVECRLDFDEEEENELTERGNEELDKKLPPWGNIDIFHDSSLEFEDVDRFLTSSGEMAGVKNTKIHYLEETDEEILSRRILELSRTNKSRSALELHRSIELSGLRPNSHACNSLLSCLLRNGLLDDGLKVFYFTKKNKLATGHTYSLILKAVANTFGCESALRIYEKFRGNGEVKKDFDAIVYNTMISICGKGNNWIQAERMWENMKDSGLKATKITYCLLVSIFVRCGQNELALDVYREMIQEGFRPGSDTMQAAICACTKEGKWELALDIFHNMLDIDLKPNLVACNALIRLLGKAGKLKLAFKILEIIKSLGHAPDAHTWNALLGALYRGERYADALQLFENLRRGNCGQLNSHLYNTALMCCSKLGLWDTALQLLWQMEASGLLVSTTSYNLAIGACEVARKPKVALQIYGHMIHQKCNADMFTHLSLIRCCIWGSLWDEVEEILSQVTPNASIYNAAIQGMCFRGETDSAKRLYAKMRKSGLKADGKTRALMLQSLTVSDTRTLNDAISQ